jgi:hypothetical protein
MQGAAALFELDKVLATLHVLKEIATRSYLPFQEGIEQGGVFPAGG